MSEAASMHPSSWFLGLSICTTCALRHTRDVFSLQIVFELADLLAALDPAFVVSRAALVGQLVQCEPVGRMVVTELDITTHRLHEMARWHVLAQVLVELELLASLRVNEWSD